uniref:Dehydrogenase ALT3 n=1 Tax=Alternaria alternata TaxID=5599 RepID=ALT3_ALTAL|nr:RecName: Full=Dehydrogenase ALT3; AltName: Full=AAL-toxin biosynthesis cluster protein 3 [Alternaria alternata]BBG74269.1 Fe-containing alcohol dehydrogenase [Alternaria alternata]
MFGSLRTYIVSSKSISATPAFEALESALGTAKIAGIRCGITSHSPWEDVFQLAQDIQATDADLIITLGGCSITDAVKLAKLFIPNNVSTIPGAEELFARIRADESVKPATIPVINVPTTLSGSEFTCAGGATNLTTGHKQVTMHSSLYADVVVLDPRLSISTPRQVWLATGVRAIDHFVEGLYGNVAALFTDMREELGNEANEDIEKVIAGALGSLLTSLLSTKENWNDEEARLQAFLAVKECPRAGHNGIGASHGIGHQLGPLGVGHGETSCIILPWVLRYNWQHGDETARRRLGLAIDTFWGQEKVAETLGATGLSRKDADLYDVVGAYISALGLPRTLGQFDIKEEQLEGLAESAMKDWCTKVNPVTLTKDKVLDILRNAK